VIDGSVKEKRTVAMINNLNKELKKTSLFEEHKKLGARIVDFEGWALPVQYKGIVKEHLTVREKVGLFDVSHMGEFLITGKDAESFLQYLTVNNVAQLNVGQAQYSMMCYENGGIVDDILIYRTGFSEYLLVVNASNIEKDFKWITDIYAGDVKSKWPEVLIENKSDFYGQIAIQGPHSRELVSKLIDVRELKYYHFKEETVLGHSTLVSRTGYTGELGYEIYVDRKGCVDIWNSLLDQGESLGVMPIGLGARDTLRFEVCFPLYGNELTKDYTPIEAGLKWVVKVDKGDFIGRSELLNQLEQGIHKKLVALELMEPGIARQGYSIVDNETKDDIGVVTSGTKSPSLNKATAMGYIDIVRAKMDNIVSVKIRDAYKKAKVVKKPLYKKKK